MENDINKSGNVQILMQDSIIDPVQPMRDDMDRDALYELANNIKQNGLINPITVRPVEWCENHKCAINTSHPFTDLCSKGLRYEVVAGHRRFTACKIAGKIRIECVVRDLSDTEVFAIKAAENIERADVDLVDESKFISEFMNVTGKTIPEIAKELNRSEEYVKNRLIVGLMDKPMQQALKEKTMSLGVALKLIQITDEKIRAVWTQMAIRDGISVAQADYWLHGWRVNQLPGGTQSTEPPSDYIAGTPTIVKFKCALSGIEEDARQFRTILLHESQIDTFNAIAQEFQSGNTTESTGEEQLHAEPRTEEQDGRA